MSEPINHSDAALLMALQLGKIQAGFLGQTAHELRSPMSHIMSLQQLILTDLCEDPAEEREFIAQCYAASQKFMQLLDLVVDVSKLDYGATKPKSTPFDVMGMMAELESIWGVKAKNRNLNLQFPTVPENFALAMVGDRQRIYQFFMTLINTTINETPTGDIIFHYEQPEGDRLAFQLRCQCDHNFWQDTRVKDLEIKAKPTLQELQAAAEAFEFSPALKWQLCTKLITTLGGQIKQDYSSEGVIQVTGWLPLENKK
ncbi:sensor histidine kinase [[Limnothrix rosea] IAM M-220]|uniref:sensor histidine kinase n=1 Tax=[Limnothrix rosea] IAM M-220 TaxID=454133 RepID=UPI00095A286E|nr:histidine kinase dimerization/phospho-acceptor domain-containing protein [[Limnothrix rosea] IAM M-220]OKH19575.1 hypothetical protein NIES208_01875 [[Limnothrix rosea] IAM M-220]